MKTLKTVFLPLILLVCLAAPVLGGDIPGPPAPPPPPEREGSGAFSQILTDAILLIVKTGLKP